MIISDRMDANKKSKMLPRDQKLLPTIGVFLSFSKMSKTGDFVVGSWIKWE